MNTVNKRKKNPIKHKEPLSFNPFDSSLMLLARLANGLRTSPMRVRELSRGPKEKVSASDEEWSAQVRVSVRWGDMDAFGHVNNAVYLKYFEDARLNFMSRVGFTGQLEHESVILADTYCKFIRPLFFPDTVSVKIRTAELSPAHWLMEAVVCADSLGGGIAAYGTAKLVFYDYRRQQKIPVPPLIKAFLEQEMQKLPSAPKQV